MKTENHNHHKINVQLFAYDVVNGNKRQYLPESVKLVTKEHPLYAVSEAPTEEFDVQLRNVAGWMDKMYVTHEGVFADLTISTQLPDGRVTLEKLDSGEYCFVPRGVCTKSFETPEGVQVIQDMTLYGFNLVKVEESSYNVEKVDGKTWRIKR